MVDRDPEGDTHTEVWAAGIHITNRCTVCTIDPGRSGADAEWVAAREADAAEASSEPGQLIQFLIRQYAPAPTAQAGDDA